MLVSWSFQIEVAVLRLVPAARNIMWLATVLTPLSTAENTCLSIQSLVLVTTFRCHAFVSLSAYPTFCGHITTECIWILTKARTPESFVSARSTTSRSSYVIEPFQNVRGWSTGYIWKELDTQSCEWSCHLQLASSWGACGHCLAQCYAITAHVNLHIESNCN